MNMPLFHRRIEPNPISTRDLSGMPEAFQRAYGPTEAFPNDFPELERPNIVPIPYRGHRTINPRSRGSCRIFAVLPDLKHKIPRIYGLDSQLEYHHLALTLADTSVQQVHEQVGPIPYTKEDGRRGMHFIDLLITRNDGRRIAVAVKPTSRLQSGRFIRELRQLKKSMPDGIADEVRLVTEQCFRRSDAVNASNYLRFALCPDPEIDQRLRDVLTSVVGEITVGDLTRFCRAGGRGFRSIFRAIFEGGLERVSSGRINLFSMVRCPQ